MDYLANELRKISYMYNVGLSDGNGNIYLSVLRYIKSAHDINPADIIQAQTKLPINKFLRHSLFYHTSSYK